ncbi:MAG: M48 family metalloprotease [Luteitalea sp.]|nr:M48 family metalloprotease [Luteitalea sp.]
MSPTRTMRHPVTARAATLIATVILALLVACATNPVTGRREFNLMSEAQEIEIGKAMDPDVRREFGIYDDASLQKYVESIGLRMAKVSERPDLPWHFTVVDSPAVNAFALPGGYIYITRGILAYLNDEAELAGVLGHEIGHVTARHAAQQYTRATSAGAGLTLASIFVPEVRPLGQAAEASLGLLFLKHGRDDELQADQLGATYAAHEGWDPEGVPGMLNTLGRISEEQGKDGTPNWLLTHPQPEDRVARIQETVQKLGAEAAGKSWQTDRQGFLQRVDGVIYGDNPREGVVRGTDFLHPGLRFRVTFPQNWTVQNSPTRIAAQPKGGNLAIQLDVADKASGRNLEEALVQDMRGAGFKALAGGATTINGLTAAQGTFQGRIQNVGDVGVMATYIQHASRVFRVLGIAPAKTFNDASETFRQSARSFEPLSAAEAERIRPNVLRLYTVRSGDTWESIAKGAGRGVVSQSTLALMNASSANDPPRSGEVVKIVNEG